MKSVVAIPTKGRRYVLKENLLKLLESIDKKRIYIFVEPQDYTDYLNYSWDGYNLVKLDKNDMKLTYSRYFIQKYFEGREELVWQIDDNMEHFYKRGEDMKLKDIFGKDVLSMFEFLETQIRNYALLTIGFRHLNCFQEEDKKENQRAWAIVLLNNNLLVKNNIYYDLKSELFQDYDMVAQILDKKLKTICFYNYAFGKEMAKNTGGCQGYRNEELSVKVCDYLKRKYKGKIDIFYNKKHKIYEPQFLWSKFTKEIKHDWW